MNFESILQLADEQSRPNFTQLQLAIAELDALDAERVNAASAYAQLRKTMEKKFGLVPVEEAIARLDAAKRVAPGDD